MTELIVAVQAVFVVVFSGWIVYNLGYDRGWEAHAEADRPPDRRPGKP